MPKRLKISAMYFSNRACSRDESGFRPASDADEFFISMPSLFSDLGSGGAGSRRRRILSRCLSQEQRFAKLPLPCRSRQPFLDAARRLVDTGYSPSTALVMRHAATVKTI
jgi:hypothetical protein